MALKFFFLAGEASGDLHAAKLIAAIRAHEAAAKFVGMGGKAMAAAGLDVVKDLEGMQVTGFWEVARHYNFFVRTGDLLLDRLKQERPDALICVDYPGFNLRFAEKVRRLKQELDIPILYYIVPQVWAWKPMRAKKMAKLVDRAYCVFDFEPPFFEQFGLKTTFIGHPLVDETAPRNRLQLPPGRKTVALLPGSRANEFNAHIAPMCEGFNLAQRKLNNLRGLLSIKKGIRSAFHIRPSDDGTFSCEPEFASVAQQSRLELTPQSDADESALEKANDDVEPHSYLAPSAADFSVVKSGTSTLESGLAGNPMCALYRGSWISYAIVHQLVNIPVFSLVNIVLGRYAIPELMQEDVTPARIAQEIERGLNDEKFREQQIAALAELPKKLGGPGASDRAARDMLKVVRGR